MTKKKLYKKSIETNSDMQEILEPFTLLLENHPLEFSRAREQAKSIEAKPFTRNNEKDDTPHKHLPQMRPEIHRPPRTIQNGW